MLLVACSEPLLGEPSIDRTSVEGWPAIRLRDGWRLDQAFALGIGGCGAAKYYEMNLDGALGRHSTLNACNLGEDKDVVVILIHSQSAVCKPPQ